MTVEDTAGIEAMLRPGLPKAPPMPPLPGMGYSLKDDMLVPVGYDLFPPVIRSLVNERFNGDKQMYLLFYPDGSYTKIPLSALIPVTRSAVRLTAETFSHVSS